MLESINQPKDIKKLSLPRLTELTGELRAEILRTVSKNGGHLASNLGIVEATVMLHRVFNMPKDDILFDVSHQCYAHKLLTGRFARFGTLRQTDGISGFTNREESEYDAFTLGHSGSAVSAAIGMATAKKLSGDDSWTVAVIGDASCSNGMVFEALNSIQDRELRLVLVLNDNGMSISKNNGRLAGHLSLLRTSAGYLRLKTGTERGLKKIPLIGHPLVRGLKGIKHLLRFLIYKDNLFQSLGIDYLGPADGHGLSRLEAVFSEAKRRDTVTLVHIITKKGKGYPMAEAQPELYHSVGAFDPEVGALPGKRQFSDEFGDTMLSLAEDDGDICAVCAAMCGGTGLDHFSHRFPRRFFDVGIGEEHAVTFACGLAREGKRPVVAIYSTFIQRCFDQLVQDAALQKLSIVLALDRAGLVSGDGATHHGVLDCAMLSCVPGASIWCPETYGELSSSLEAALETEGVSAVRYPRGGEAAYDRSCMQKLGNICYSLPEDRPEAVIITYGRVTENALLAAGLLDGRVRVIKLIKVFPLDVSTVLPLIHGASLIYFLEEAMESGCLSQKYAAELSAAQAGARFFRRTLGDGFLPHGDMEHLFGLAGLLPSQIAEEIKGLLS